MQAVFCSNSVHILTIELIRNFREVFYRKRGFIKGLRSCISFTKQTNIIFFESLDFSKQAFACIILKKVSKTCQRIFAKMSLLRACTCIQFKSVPDCVPTSSVSCHRVFKGIQKGLVYIFGNHNIYHLEALTLSFNSSRLIFLGSLYPASSGLKQVGLTWQKM